MSEEERLLFRTIIGAEVNGYGIRLELNDGTVFDYDATDGGMSCWEYSNVADREENDE